MRVKLLVTVEVNIYLASSRCLIVHFDRKKNWLRVLTITNHAFGNLPHKR